MRTVKGLTLDPGTVARSYIKGNRVLYVGPLGYLFIVTTIMILTFQILGVEVADFLKSNSEIMGFRQDVNADVSDKQQAFTNDLLAKMSENFRLLTAGLIPFIALWALWLYKKSKYNWIEHIVNFTYLNGHGVWLTVISIIIFKIGSINGSIITGMLGLAYHVYGVIKFYQVKQKIIGSLKALLLWVLGYITFVLLMVIVVAIYTMIFLSTN